MDFTNTNKNHHQNIWYLHLNNDDEDKNKYIFSALIVCSSIIVCVSFLFKFIPSTLLYMCKRKRLKSIASQWSVQTIYDELSVCKFVSIRSLESDKSGKINIYIIFFCCKKKIYKIKTKSLVTKKNLFFCLFVF